MTFLFDTMRGFMPTKANSKKRRGRPRSTKPRTPSGQISRAKFDPRSVVVAARQRLFGVDKTEAQRPEAGTAVGRLYIQGRITAEELEAARRFVNLARSAHSLVHAPKGFEVDDHGSAIDWDAFDQTQALEYTEKAVRVLALWRGLQVSLQSMGWWSAVEKVVIDDIDVVDPDERDNVIKGLSTIARHFK